MYAFEGVYIVKATVVDLRYKMNDVVKALDRNEEVTVLYRGKIKGTLVPVNKDNQAKIADHPFFGMQKQVSDKSVNEEVHNLRCGRYHDL